MLMREEEASGVGRWRSPFSSIFWQASSERWDVGLLPWAPQGVSRLSSSMETGSFLTPKPPIYSPYPPSAGSRAGSGISMPSLR